MPAIDRSLDRSLCLQVVSAWTKACDIALAHGTVPEIAATVGMVSVRFANIGDTWNAMDSFQRTVAYDQQQRVIEFARIARAEAGSEASQAYGEALPQESARKATGRWIETNAEWHIAVQIYTACGDNHAGE